MNKYRGEAEVTLAGREYTLVFDYNAICELEQRTGKSINALFFSGDLQNYAIREALFVGLKKRNKLISPNRVGKMIDEDPSQLTEITKVLVKVLLAARGETEETIDQILDVLDSELEDSDETPPKLEPRKEEEDKDPLP